MFNFIEKNKEKIFWVLAIILIVLFAISISPKSLQNDTFYTVTIGKLISENGIDGQDHFSWHEGLPYEYPHWLYDLGMYKIFELGGWDAIYISTCIFAAILGICIFISNSRLTKNSILSFFVTIAVLYLMKSYIAARAQLVTFILFIIFLYNIEQFLQNKKIINAVMLLLIQTIIANLHVAVWPFTFVLYLPYVAEYLIACLIEIVLYKKVPIFVIKDKIRDIKRKIAKPNIDKAKLEILKNKLQILENKLEDKKIKAERIKEKREQELKNAYKITITKNNNSKWLILVMIVSIATGLLTPLGKTPYTYTYLTMIGNTVKNINEHLPLTLTKNVEMMSTLVVLLTLLIFTKAKVKLSDLFMLGGLTYLMFSSRRQQSMFVLIGSVAFTRTVTNWLIANFNYSNEKFAKKWINAFTMFVVSAILLSFSSNLYNKVKNDKYINESTYPVQASEWILENLDVKNIKLFNEYNYGSYLLYKGIPVFIDSRADLYAPEFNTKTGKKVDGNDIFIDFINESSISVYYGDIFKQYDVTHVILYKGSKVNMLIQKADSEKYKEIYSDNSFVIYEVR
ncbi:MAG: hypothetical protein ILA02_05490 [Clostridia bacterium]|nr:hypothetical protein [Clostridia bacterium]